MGLLCMWHQVTGIMIVIRAVLTARALRDTGLWEVTVCRRKWSSLREKAVLKEEVLKSSVEHPGGTGAPAFFPFPLHRW